MKLKIFVILTVVLFPAVWPSGHATVKVRACDLLKKEEVSEITGKKVGKIELIDESRSHGYTMCQYYTPQGEYFLAVTHTLNARLEWDMFYKSQSGVVTGIGDDARWEDPWLRVLIKDMILKIYLPGKYEVKSRDEVKAMAISLAKKALKRIQP